MPETATKVREVGLEINLGAEPYFDLDNLLTGFDGLNKALTDLGYSDIMTINDERVQPHSHNRPFLEVEIPLSKYTDLKDARLIFYQGDECHANFNQHSRTWPRGIDMLFECLRLVGVKEIKSNLAITITIS